MQSCCWLFCGSGGGCFYRLKMWERLHKPKEDVAGGPSLGYLGDKLVEVLLEMLMCVHFLMFLPASTVKILQHSQNPQN